MNVNWFKNPNNIEYMDIDAFVETFEKNLKINHLKYQIEKFRENPRRQGKVILAGNQTSIKIFVPKLTFEERFDHDENVWVYLGKSHPCYCLANTESWRDKAYFFFTHKECEYFPCHETKNPEGFNCLFCFCPLYTLGKHCGGNFRYSGDIKDCSNCMVPHLPDSYGYIMSKFNDIAAVMTGKEKHEDKKSLF